MRFGLLWLAVLGLADYLRLAHVAENPSRYTDQATHLLIGQQLQPRRHYHYFAHHHLDAASANNRFAFFSLRQLQIRIR